METNNTQAEERLRNVRQYAVQCIKDECDATLKLIDQLDDNFDRAVSMMYHCKGKIIVTGVGKSGNIGAKIAATLSSTGTPAFFINPLDVYHGDLGVMTKDDVVLALSNSGQTDELLRFIPMVLHMNVPIIGMSGNPQSLLAKYATAHLLVKVEKEACPLNLAPTSSTTAALVMGDALAIALMEVRDFKPKDFAQFHPGGELGKRLLTTAQDVMRSDDLPIIPKENAPRRGYHPREQGQTRTGCGSGGRQGHWTDHRRRHSSCYGALAGRVLRPYRQRHHDENS